MDTTQHPAVDPNSDLICDTFGCEAMRVSIEPATANRDARVHLKAGTLPCIYDAELTPLEARRLARRLMVQAQTAERSTAAMRAAQQVAA